MLVSQPEGLPRLICKLEHRVGKSEHKSGRGLFYCLTVQSTGTKDDWCSVFVCLLVVVVLLFAIHNMLILISV